MELDIIKEKLGNEDDYLLNERFLLKIKKQFPEVLAELRSEIIKKFEDSPELLVKLFPRETENLIRKAWKNRNFGMAIEIYRLSQKANKTFPINLEGAEALYLSLMEGGAVEGINNFMEKLKPFFKDFPTKKMAEGTIARLKSSSNNFPKRHIRHRLKTIRIMLLSKALDKNLKIDYQRCAKDTMLSYAFKHSEMDKPDKLACVLEYFKILRKSKKKPDKKEIDLLIEVSKERQWGTYDQRIANELCRYKESQSAAIGYFEGWLIEFTRRETDNTIKKVIEATPTAFRKKLRSATKAKIKDRINEISELKNIEGALHELSLFVTMGFEVEEKIIMRVLKKLAENSPYYAEEFSGLRVMRLINRLPLDKLDPRTIELVLAKIAVNDMEGKPSYRSKTVTRLLNLLPEDKKPIYDLLLKSCHK